jgi:hypothetical protein
MMRNGRNWEKVESQRRMSQSQLLATRVADVPKLDAERF